MEMRRQLSIYWWGRWCTRTIANVLRLNSDRLIRSTMIFTTSTKDSSGFHPIVFNKKSWQNNLEKTRVYSSIILTVSFDIGMRNRSLRKSRVDASGLLQIFNPIISIWRTLLNFDTFISVDEKEEQLMSRVRGFF